MPAIAIRLYRAEDLSKLIALFRGSVRNIARLDYTESQLRAWAPDAIDPEQFARRLTAKPTWVAESEGHVVGFSDLEPDGHIDMLYVHPDYQRRGVARALLAHIERVAQTRGLDRLYTEASITARPAFAASGFHVLAAQTVTVRGESLTNYRMQKRLEPPGATLNST
jgi:putative acetyltransferase